MRIEVIEVIEALEAIEVWAEERNPILEHGLLSLAIGTAIPLVAAKYYHSKWPKRTTIGKLGIVPIYLALLLGAFVFMLYGLIVTPAGMVVEVPFVAFR